ncbi:MAG: toxin-antitoxin system YwqK family antitoxin [Sediminibacterium sp.]
MKTKLFTLIALLVLTASAYAQTNSQLLDAQLNVTTNKAAAKYTRSVTQVNESLFEVKINFQTGELMMTGSYIDEALTVPQGEFVYFFANGTKESQGAYLAGQRVGSWQRWNFDGMQKPDRYYQEPTALLSAK